MSTNKAKPAARTAKAKGRTAPKAAAPKVAAEKVAPKAAAEKATTKVVAEKAAPKAVAEKAVAEKAVAEKPAPKAAAETPRVEVVAPAAVEAPKAPANNPLHTRLCELFGVQYPIVQTGMGWVSGARLTAATSAAGGLGILAAATMTLPELEQAIAKVKERTDKPFGVNLRADQSDIMQRVDLLIREKIKVASFAQAPGQKVIERLKSNGVVTMPTIGARRHAEKVAKWGVDAVIAQGHEGGGHTGTVPTSLLIEDVRRAVDIPVVGAGGFSTGHGLVAALAYGADGIAMGTRFLLTQESQVPAHIKAQYVKATVNDTVVTLAIDGYPQRVIRTAMIDALEKANPLLRFPRAAVNAAKLARITGTKLGELLEEGIAMKKGGDRTWAQLAMAANAPMLTKATMVDGKLEAGILPTGQVAGVIDELPTVAELIARIMREAEETLARFER